MNLPKFAVMRPIATIMLLLFLFILGCMGLKHLSIDLFPNMNHPYYMISTQAENLNPDEVESRITAPLEKILSTLPNITSIHSTSSAGQSIITLKFKWGSSMTKNKEKIMEKFEAIKTILPKEISEPAILPFDPSTMPIMQWVIYQDNFEMGQMKKFAEQNIIPPLQNIDGVALVSLEGIKERQFQIFVDPQKLAAYELTIEQIKNAIIHKHMNLPIGSIIQEDQMYHLQITSHYTTLFDLLNLEIPSTKGMIPLQHLAQMEEKGVPKGHYAYINGKPCIGLSVFKEDGRNTVQIAHAIKKKIKEMEKTTTGAVKFDIVFDQSHFITQAISSIYSAIFLGGIFAAGVLYAFLRNFRSTLIIFFTIPVAVVINFFGMYIFHQNLNLLTLGALSLGIGMMIDNAIVIVESIEQQKLAPKQSAIQGASMVFQPMLASTLTSIVVFIPFLFVKGLVAQLFFPLAIVIILTQITSLFVSFTFIPLISRKEGSQKRFFKKRTKNLLANLYQILLPLLIRKPKRIIGGCLILLGISLLFLPFLDIEFLPHQDQSFIIVHTKCKEGTTQKHTEKIALQLFPKLEKIKGVKLVYGTVGGSPSASMVMEQLKSNEANFYCLLEKKKDRSASDQQIAKEIEKHLNQMPNFTYTISASDPGFFDSNIKIRILSPNRSEAITASNQLQTKLKENHGLSQVRMYGHEAIPVINLKIKEEKTAITGIEQSMLAMQLHTMIHGQKIYTLLDRKEDIPIHLFLRSKDTAITDQALNQFNIFIPDHGAFPLGTLVTMEKTQQISQQSRYNQQPQILLTTKIKSQNKRKIFQQIRQIAYTIEKDFPTTKILFDGQMTQIKESFGQMIFVCLFAVLFIYMILAAQFESFLIPLILIFSIPVISIGIIFSLLAFHSPLSASSFVGILLLIGVVINNAILLIDSIMHNVQAGKNLYAAILKGAPTRIRPIFMTATTTILGVLPLLLGAGEGIEFQRPMSIVIIFGLISSTFITLVLIPSILILLEKHIMKAWQKN